MGEAVDDLIPIFPLPAVVLFPRVRAPLHIFEPRYREMTRAALAGSRRIGMVTVPEAHRGDCLLRDGPPPEVICEVAGELGHELIAVSTHGRSGLQHLLIGSVAERVVRMAPCSVVVVR